MQSLSNGYFGRGFLWLVLLALLDLCGVKFYISMEENVI